jgi:hypothetical protein
MVADACRMEIGVGGWSASSNGPSRRWNSWEATMATTPKRPSRSAASRNDRSWSSLRSSQRVRSGFLKCKTGISCSSAKLLTAERKRVPIACITAGEVTGSPRWPVMNVTTWPATWSEARTR